MSGLAVTYYSQGKYAQAEALLTQAIEIQRRVLGPEHPDTLLSMSGLAEIYDKEGQHGKAEGLLNDVLNRRRRALGPQDPDTLDTMAELAQIDEAQGKFTASEALAREAVAGDRKKRPDDWQRFFTESVLGSSLAAQKKYAEAESLSLAGYRGMDAPAR